MACGDCDAVYVDRGVASDGARCTRCHAVIAHAPVGTPDRALALALASLLLLLAAHAFPLLKVSFQGQLMSTTLTGAVAQLYGRGLYALAGLVFITVVLLPLLQVTLMIWLLAPLRFGRVAWGAGPLFRWVRLIKPWSQLEILMLGVVIALGKLRGNAGIDVGGSLWCLAAAIALIIPAGAGLEPRAFWATVERISARRRHHHG
jgi:paraquat-inducible protein A